jgi:hypothetical protein
MFTDVILFRRYLGKGSNSIKISKEKPGFAVAGLVSDFLLDNVDEVLSPPHTGKTDSDI